ncbi:hypothetical protein TgHK011_002131 [Trichoderma gracile]|nr:hypothetical protein TgHK011_002131 [Trichoderma gracile]
MSVREFWFEHLSGPEALVIPRLEDYKRWFSGGPEFDKLCIERFGPTLAAIRSRGITSGHDIIYALQPTDSHDWLSIVLLLDQLPRNCFRGAASSSVFTYWDPMARDVALAALERGIPDRWPEIRWRFACRAWFYVPLMHSEDVRLHELAVEQYKLLARDIESLLTSSETDGGCESDIDREYRLAAQKVVRIDPDAARRYAQLNLGFEERHWAIVQRFGRYPHRNGVLGRETTAEEREYLDNGGDSFGG